jgi:cytosine/adenosine deaminase-related metal-dependent hydrolase
MKLIISARWIVTGIDGAGEPQILEDHAIVVEDGAIKAIVPRRDLRPEAGTVTTDYLDHVMVPGFVNSHHHVGLTPLQRGSLDLPLELWSVSRIPARAVDPYLDTLYSAFEMIASGVTTVGHIQSRGGGTVEEIHGTASAVIRAYRTIGMRVSYSYPLIDQNRLVYEADDVFCARLPEGLKPRVEAMLRGRTLPVDDYFALLEQLLADNEGERLSRIQLAPANLHWCSDGALLRLEDTSRAHGLPMHMHLLETVYQKEYALRRTGGKSAVRHLAELGLMGPRMTLGHGVWLTEDDIDIVAETGTCICHNCSSNFRLRSGIAPVNRFLGKGIEVALGIDEAGINDDRDMLQEMRMVLNVHRTPGMDDDVPTAPAVFRMATEGGAKTTAFGESIGRLEPGRRFDAVLFDWREVTVPFQSPDVPLLDVLLRRARIAANKAVYIDGELVYENGNFLKIDRQAVLAELACQQNQPPDAEDEARKQLADELMPHVKALYRGWQVKTGGKPFQDYSAVS